MMARAVLRAGRLALVVFLAALAGCGTSPETRRREAQSNADKYWELIKAGKPEEAYNQTFSTTYKGQLDPETFVKFQRALEARTGPVTGFQVVHFDADPAKPLVVLTYALQTANVPEPSMFDVSVEEEGSEWRIAQIEPKIQKKAPAAPPATPIRPPTAPPGK
jgi:hypothetical protein